MAKKHPLVLLKPFVADKEGRETLQTVYVKGGTYAATDATVLAEVILPRGADTPPESANAGHYPKYEEVIPKGVENARYVRLNPHLLRKVANFMAEMQDKDFQGVTLEIRGELDPMVLRGENEDGTKFRAVLMPMSKTH